MTPQPTNRLHTILSRATGLDAAALTVKERPTPPLIPNWRRYRPAAFSPKPGSPGKLSFVGRFSKSSWQWLSPNSGLRGRIVWLMKWQTGHPCPGVEQGCSIYEGGC
jgi:hypothetical protein